MFVSFSFDWRIFAVNLHWLAAALGSEGTVNGGIIPFHSCDSITTFTQNIGEFLESPQSSATEWQRCH